MTDEELIEIKSNEIRRLHQVCRNKDEGIRLAINSFRKLKNLEAFNEDYFHFSDIIINLTKYLDE